MYCKKELRWLNCNEWLERKEMRLKMDKEVMELKIFSLNRLEFIGELMELIGRLGVKNIERFEEISEEYWNGVNKVMKGYKIEEEEKDEVSDIYNDIKYWVGKYEDSK